MAIAAALGHSGGVGRTAAIVDALIEESHSEAGHVHLELETRIVLARLLMQGGLGVVDWSVRGFRQRRRSGEGGWSRVRAPAWKHLG